MKHGRTVARVFKWIGLGLAALVVLALLYVLALWVTLPSVAALGERGDPGPTAFMKEDRCPTIDRTWVPLDRIDPRLACAVMWSEDTAFFRHGGIDWQAVRDAARLNWRAGRVKVGASTIPMQLARNLYLSRGRTLSRKIQEMFLARRLVDRYQRLRLLEVYLNVAELGPCVYGAEAGARHWFGHGARTLDLAEATFLAAMLPRPRTAPGHDRADVRRLCAKQKRLVRLLSAAGLVGRQELYAARLAVDALWAAGIGRSHTAAVDGPAPRRWLDRACGSIR